MMKAEKEKNQDHLVEKLTPSLHQEGACDLAASVKAVFLGRDFAGANSIFHPACCRHRIFTADSDPIKKESPNVANNPSILGHAPCGREHDQSNEHNGGVLDQTPSSTEPRISLVPFLDLLTSGAVK